VTEIDDGFSAGKPQLDFRVRPEASSAGLTPAELGRQLRSAFYGAEALRQQRGRNEVRVMVRRPEAERQSEGDIESTIIRLPSGAERPLGRAAEVKRGNAYTSIVRTDGRRVVDVTADVDKTQTTADKVLAALKEGPLERLAARYPGIGIGFEGERRARGEAMSSLGRGFAFAMVCIFALLAIPFRSYVQPLIVMTAIPFGMVGALMGHMALGYGLDIMSLMGIVELSGVVVNDSLVLIDAANQRRWRGASPFDAILSAGVRRFRPIVLTSLTTFFGLAPMIFERSAEARFLVPMALSLGFGILFATLIVLLLVPALYLVIEDLVSLYGGSAVAERHESTAAGDKDLASVS
jgi:multidrug efflux pump subunit AcrB